MSKLGPHHPKVRTTVLLSRAALIYLRRVALDEAERDGGKPSVSAVLERLTRDAAAETTTTASG